MKTANEILNEIDRIFNIVEIQDNSIEYSKKLYVYLYSEIKQLLISPEQKECLHEYCTQRTFCADCGISWELVK